MKNTGFRYLAVAALITLASSNVLGEERSQSGESATGTIRGTVSYLADPQYPWRLGRYYVRNARTGEIAEAVVSIAGRELASPADAGESSTVTVDQKNFQFSPETVAIRAGDRVRFLNSDPHTHNVKTSHPKYSFNVTMQVGGEHVEAFEYAGGIYEPYRIDCVFHSAMRAWVFVFDHPWFQVTGNDGSFVIECVPPGDYRLDVVHPAGGLRARQTVQVLAGETVQANVQLKAAGAKP